MKEFSEMEKVNKYKKQNKSRYAKMLQNTTLFLMIFIILTSLGGCNHTSTVEASIDNDISAYDEQTVSNNKLELNGEDDEKKESDNSLVSDTKTSESILNEETSINDASVNDASLNEVSLNTASDLTSSSENTVTELKVNEDDLEVLQEPVKMYVTINKLNVRKGPDKAFELMGSLDLNTEVSVIANSKSTPWKEILFLGEKAFVHGDYLGENMVDISALMAAKEAEEAKKLADAKALEEAIALQNAEKEKAEKEKAEQEALAKAAEQQAPPVPVIKNPAKVLFIGDSRTCQMQNASNGKYNWICEYGSKYDWFEGTAVPLADTMVGKGTKVVICMGVNDPDNCGKYVSLVNRKAADWNARGAIVYYVSVNPVEPPYDFKTDAIESFNLSAPASLSGVRWIDTASVIKKGGYVLEDGIHYDATSTASIYSMIVNSIR